MSTDQLVAARPPISVKRSRRPPERGHPRRSDFRWGIAFIAPYAAVLFAFIVYPFGYALWIAKQAVAVSGGLLRRVGFLAFPSLAALFNEEEDDREGCDAIPA